MLWVLCSVLYLRVAPQLAGCLLVITAEACPPCLIRVLRAVRAVQFAASKGGQFPAPQHSRGLSMLVAPEADANPAAKPDAADVKGTGVLLLGDAAHCFPPDLGKHSRPGWLRDSLVGWVCVFFSRGPCTVLGACYCGCPFLLLLSLCLPLLSFSLSLSCWPSLCS